MQQDCTISLERNAMSEGGILWMCFDAFSSKSSDRNILINTYEQGCSIAFWCRSFTGKERDEETGFGYFGARYLGHELMTMWLSVDPMADKYPSISPYVYCAWNPLRLVDPNGKEVMENEDEWKYNTTTGLLSHVSDKGGNDQQTVHCVSNIGNQEILDETISFNGQIDDMFDFSVISDSWDHIIDGCIQTVGGLVTAVGGVAAGVGSCGLAIPLGAGIAGYGGYQLGTGLAAIAEGVWGGSSGNKYERQDMIKSICSWFGLGYPVASVTGFLYANVEK